MRGTSVRAKIAVLLALGRKREKWWCQMEVITTSNHTTDWLWLQHRPPKLICSSMGSVGNFPARAGAKNGPPRGAV